VPKKNLWEQYPALNDAVNSLPDELKALLLRHEAAALCTEWLRKNYPLRTLRDSAGEAVFRWDVIGLALGSRARVYEAISVHRELYNRMCEAQNGYRWIHKALPLVRLRDWHRGLGHPWHEERYLLLTLIEDAIRDRGNTKVEQGGIYHRFRWEDGRPDKEFREISKASWKEFTQHRDCRVFPEEILSRLGPKVFKSAAADSEVDLYEINTTYALKLLDRSTRADWRALERLSAYQLSCIPGFEVEQQKLTEASIFDIFVRVRGRYADFRRDLGTYLLGECKNWGEPVGPSVIAYLAQNMTFHDCKAGILFSWNGITGRKDAKYAALTVLRAYHHSGRIILVLDRTDFTRASQGQALQEILRTKYEQVRFDLPARS
jgi:hypothetical protein